MARMIRARRQGKPVCATELALPSAHGTYVRTGAATCEGKQAPLAYLVPWRADGSLWKSRVARAENRSCQGYLGQRLDLLMPLADLASLALDYAPGLRTATPGVR